MPKKGGKKGKKKKQVGLPDKLEKKTPQSYVQSYEEGKISPEMLRLIHRRNNLTPPEERQIEDLFARLWKNGDCLEEERFFLARDNAGKFIYKPDEYDMSRMCPFKKIHIEYGWEQRKNPKCR